MSRLIHGGRLAELCKELGLSSEAWLDLSTGISPWSWPVPELPENIWRELPSNCDDLTHGAASYYGCDSASVLAVPGSQYAISRIPSMLALGKVALPWLGYFEHEQAWLGAGHQPVYYKTPEQLLALCERTDVKHAVLINPENPTGRATKLEVVEKVFSLLAQRGGYLVIDEAFADSDPSLSAAPLLGHEQLIILRSLGKFFGLAGVRLGFVLANARFLSALADGMDPWSVSHPARFIGAAALRDQQWQRLQRQRIQSESNRCAENLEALGLAGVRIQRAGLFVSLISEAEACGAERLEQVYRRLLAQKIYLRLYQREQHTVLRLGLFELGCESRLHSALLHAFES